MSQILRRMSPIRLWTLLSSRMWRAHLLDSSLRRRDAGGHPVHTPEWRGLDLHTRQVVRSRRLGQSTDRLNHPLVTSWWSELTMRCLCCVSYRLRLWEQCRVSECSHTKQWMRSGYLNCSVLNSPTPEMASDGATFSVAEQCDTRHRWRSFGCYRTIEQEQPHTDP